MIGTAMGGQKKSEINFRLGMRRKQSQILWEENGM